ncbi:hypothetical protein SKAU_G00139530 [Synaphobranchus kaupii]|uniref:Uncharacterized protein n=1 Tax=Synaphobranchus kaupii TaxID=118154 RepID=A0A9Q1FS14_SYNKA|nr:hypothetical protein SKAU_G00139530 [Synaphobranchus kaupii]
MLGMNVITECCKALFQGGHPGVTAFGSTVSSKAKKAWDQAFAVCRRIETELAPDGKVGVARLTRQNLVERRPLGSVYRIDPSEVHGERELILCAADPSTAEVFAAHDDDFGRTDAVKHQIPTGTAPPSRERIEESLTCLKQSRWYSTLDLHSGY